MWRYNYGLSNKKRKEGGGGQVQLSVISFKDDP